MLDHAVAQHDDRIAHRHGLDLIVGHVDGRGLQPLMQILDLGPHLGAQAGVEVRERLVEQEHARRADDRPSHRDTLPLTARQLTRQAIEVRLQTEDCRGVRDLAVDDVGALAPQLQREAHVAGDGHVRIERVVLKDHRHVAVLGRRRVDHAIADANLAAIDRLEARDHPQQRRFAASRWPDEHDEGAVGDVQRDATDHLGRAERLADVRRG